MNLFLIYVFAIITFWNNFPNDIRKITAISTLKLALKTFFFKQYENSAT